MGENFNLNKLEVNSINISNKLLNEYEILPRMELYWYELNGCINNINDNVDLILSIEDNFDIGLLEESLNIVIDRHESLRCNLCKIDSKVKMVIKDEGQRVCIKYEDLSLKNYDKKEVVECIRKSLEGCIDLQTDVLVRTFIFKLKIEEYIFVLSIPHIISDFWSVRIIKNELEEVYSKLINGESIDKYEYKHKTFHFKDYMNWINNKINTSNNIYKEYWIKKLSGKDLILKLPHDVETNGAKNGESDNVFIHLNEAIIQQIDDKCKKLGISKSMFLMGITNLVIANWCKLNEITITMIMNSRPAEYYNSVGFYLNSIYWNIEIENSLTINDYLLHIKSDLAELIDNKYYPSTNILEDLGCIRPKSVFYNFLDTGDISNIDDEKKLFTDITITETEDYRATMSEFELSVKSEYKVDKNDRKKELEIIFAYNKSLFNRSTIIELKNNFLTLTKYFIEDDNYKINSVYKFLNQ